MIAEKRRIVTINLEEVTMIFRLFVVVVGVHVVAADVVGVVVNCVVVIRLMLMWWYSVSQN